MKGIRNQPRYFEDGAHLLAWRDYLAGLLKDGRISRVIYFRRIKRACAQFREDSLSRAYYERRSAEFAAQKRAAEAGMPTTEKAKAAGAGQ